MDISLKIHPSFRLEMFCMIAVYIKQTFFMLKSILSVVRMHCSIISFILFVSVQDSQRKPVTLQVGRGRALA
jgi:hypothetical protein